jgi:hypothetical protein
VPAKALFGYLTRSSYRNTHPFGQALRRFLNAMPQFELLPPDTDWMQGGCLILADALSTWSAGELKAGGVVRIHSDQTPFLDHAFAFLPLFGAASRVLIDGDGLAEARPFEQKLTQLYRIRDFEVRYQDCAQHAVGILRDRGASRRLAAQLADRFGRFDRVLIAPIN